MKGVWELRIARLYYEAKKELERPLLSLRPNLVMGTSRLQKHRVCELGRHIASKETPDSRLYHVSAPRIMIHRIFVRVWRYPWFPMHLACMLVDSSSAGHVHFWTSSMPPTAVKKAESCYDYCSCEVDSSAEWKMFIIRNSKIFNNTATIKNNWNETLLNDVQLKVLETHKCWQKKKEPLPMKGPYLEDLPKASFFKQTLRLAWRYTQFQCQKRRQHRQQPSALAWAQHRHAPCSKGQPTVGWAFPPSSIHCVPQPCISQPGPYRNRTKS